MLQQWVDQRAGEILVEMLISLDLMISMMANNLIPCIDWMGVVSWNHLISCFSSESAWLATVWSISRLDFVCRWAFVLCGLVGVFTIFGFPYVYTLYGCNSGNMNWLTYHSGHGWASFGIGVYDSPQGFKALNDYISMVLLKNQVFLWEAGVLNNIGCKDELSI